MCDFQEREKAMVILQRDESGKPTVFCDPCLADIIQALNICGIKTKASCCGHGKQYGSVILDDGRELLIRQFVPELVKQGETIK